MRQRIISAQVTKLHSKLSDQPHCRGKKSSSVCGMFSVLYVNLLEIKESGSYYIFVIPHAKFNT